MRKQLTRAILVTGTVAAALSLGVGPAFAVTTWTVTGGTNWTSVQSSGATFTLTDTSQSPNTGFKCTTATGAGTVTDETHGTNTAIGTVTSGTFGDSTHKCTSFGIFGNPTGTSKLTANATLNVSSFASGVTTGSISNVTASLSASAFGISCTIVVTGTASVTYTNSSDLLAFITTGDSLSVHSTSGTCPGVSTGDHVTFASSGGETVTGSPVNPIQVSSP